MEQKNEYIIPEIEIIMLAANGGDDSLLDPIDGELVHN